ncbi:hypothetical protein ACLSYY_08200 [[Pasteurella] aerogenes]
MTEPSSFATTEGLFGAVVSFAGVDEPPPPPPPPEAIAAIPPINAAAPNNHHGLKAQKALFNTSPPNACGAITSSARILIASELTPDSGT